MDGLEAYTNLVDTLVEHFGPRLRAIVLFGSQSRHEAGPDSDHDIFVVIEALPRDPLARQRQIMEPLLPILLSLPERLSIVAKTPQELSNNLPPLVIDVCEDGVSLYDDGYFAALQVRIKRLLEKTGLKRRQLAGTRMWLFPEPALPEMAVPGESAGGTT
jgi:uncharacterized protein